MTFAELNRLLDSKRRTQKAEAQQKAFFDYTLAELIGHSVGRLYNSANKMPELYKAYPSLFDKEIAEEELAKRQDELSALRFKQFADTFNKRFEGGNK